MWYLSDVARVRHRIGRRACTLGVLALACTIACKPDAADSAADGTIVTPYLAIGEVLASDRIDAIDKLGAQVVEATQTHAEEAGIDEVLAAVGRISSPDIATARLAYRKMSEGVIAWLAANPDERAGLELVHCPMTFTNEGAYWVQRAGPINNPYEGAMMLRCGAKIAWKDHRRGGPPAGETDLEGMD
jgi:Cu(I)/Ag(I) efflux system membrane fusion protein